jgi:hypothetical protein
MIRAIDRAKVATLVSEVKGLCNQGRECQVNFISRELNGVSHILARFGYTSQCTMVWHHHGPNIIRLACLQDGTPIP